MNYRKNNPHTWHLCPLSLNLHYLWKHTPMLLSGIYHQCKYILGNSLGIFAKTPSWGLGVLFVKNSEDFKHAFFRKNFCYNFRRIQHAVQAQVCHSQKKIWPRSWISQLLFFFFISLCMRIMSTSFYLSIFQGIRQPRGSFWELPDDFALSVGTPNSVSFTVHTLYS